MSTIIAKRKHASNSKLHIPSKIANSYHKSMNIKEQRRANLNKLLEGFNTKREFADRCDLAPGHVSQMVNGTREVGDRVAKKIEFHLGLSHGWIDQSHGDEPCILVREKDGIYNIEDAREPTAKKIPLISWVQAGHAAEAIDNFQPGDAEEWVTPYHPPREHTYALRVSGDSMTPTFQPGMLLVVEPGMCAECGDFVIAKNGDQEATFKQYIKDGGQHYLKPLNPQYPIMEMEGFDIIGVVRDAILNLK